jgi:ABC-type proline/glycine betaine transport system ATPase subunit
MKQRVAIIRALAWNPPIFFLMDEYSARSMNHARATAG